MEAQAAEGSGQDRRLEYMGHFVTKTLKLKPEKWTRVMLVEEQKNVIKEFIDRPLPMVLIIVLTPAAQLVPSSTFPLSQLKSKGVYFVKKKSEPIPREDYKHFLVMGDLATRSIDQLSMLVDEVFVPLLSNEENYKGWPTMVAQDVQKQYHSLKSTVHQVKGQVSGQTILAMPVGVEKIVKAAKELLETKECLIDLYLKSAIEGVVIKWATQINDVMKESPSNSFSNGQNPVPASEIHFWSSRLTNLSYIFEQLRNERIRAMALILEHTDSAYYPCFKTLFKNVVTALAEAKDITLYLNPVKKHFTQLEEIDFAECKPLLVPLMHVICLLWGNSRYYCHSSKITVLLKQTCNLIIHQAKRFLDPSSIFHSDIDEAMQRLQLCIKTLKFFRDIFDYYKENLTDFFREETRPPIFWTFHPNAVFTRFDAFLDRLNTIQWFFFTVIEFLKLEKVEIGGLRGRQLSARITAVYVEFNQYFAAFASKTYDVLNPDDPTFNDDFISFQTRILELDMKLAAILCQAFDDCHNLESIFKLINIAGSVLERPKIKEEFTNKYSEIVKMLDDEMTMCEGIFDFQVNLEGDKKYFFFGRNCPPVTACLRWCQQLSMRITSPVKHFQALQHPIVQSAEGLALVKRYEELIAKLGKFENSVSEQWAEQVATQIDENLQKSLIDRDPITKMLILNFSPQLFALLREVHYLKQMEKEGIPENGIEFSEKSDIYRSYTLNLEKTIDWYNEVLINSTAVELELIKTEIEQIDALVEIGVNELNWNSENITNYLQKLRDPVASLQNRMKHTQGNLAEIRNIMSEWARIPLFERKDSKKDTVLCLEERSERKLKRYSEIEAASEKIHNLLADNMTQFSMQNRQNEQMWQDYVSFVDNVVYENLLLTVGVSMGYLAENMDPSNNYSPLFESRLELLEPNMIFVPSLDPDDPSGFNHLLVELMDDILKMSTLIKRLKESNLTSYQEMIMTNTDIIEMRKEILESVDRVIEEAAELCNGFERYSYLWYDDRNECMEYFLMFGRILDPDEIDLVLAKDPAAPQESPPTIEAFREQIDNYESLFMEIEGIKPFQIFNSWFQVDVRPFRQNLLNIVCKWGNMFKQHLVNRVTNSLTDLASFIRKADEGLMQTVTEGDYDGLVSTMAYLMQVKERAVTTDEMFEPMQETIQLLKYYDMDIPEEVNVLLQELPEQWANTKKIATTVKQQVSPLQATEVVSIRNRIANFEVHISFFREVFKNYEFFKYDCEDPYTLLNRINKDIYRLEQVMRDIQKSGSLFEVNVPEFKILKQCRKELRMLKQLWDYVYIVRTSIEDWKTTPWRKVDVENMDIECKKFAKDIRLLDKEMRPWDTFIQLESTVKNMLTSLRAVGELQNPAIRERHWNQLMVSTKSLAALPKEVTVSVILRMDRSEHPIILQDDIYSVDKP